MNPKESQGKCDNFELRRELKVRMQGKVHQGELIIRNLRKIRTKGKSDSFACSWALPPTDPKPRDIYGEDALGALLNCLAFLNNLIQGYAETGVEVWWLEKDDNGGLKPFIADMA